MNEIEKIQTASQSSTAVHKFVYPFTVSMIDTGSNPMELSSGTLVRVGNQVFVATAKHCVKSNPSGRLWILPERPRSSNEGMLGFMRIGRHPTLDLAFVELDPQSTTDYLPQHTCCELRNLRNCGCGRTNRIITVCGSPSQFTDGQGTANTPVRAVNIAFSTVPFCPSEFPAIPEGYRAADAATDVFFEYPAQALRFEEGTTIPLDSPEGFSGGGIWDQGFDSDQLWNPTDSKLIAIQSSWCRRQRYARGIQVIHWLRLLWSANEACRPQIEAAFPDESFAPLQTQ